MGSVDLNTPNTELLQLQESHDELQINSTLVSINLCFNLFKAMVSITKTPPTFTRI